jgi:predicted metal-dependent HD superfamily phosphohydrolase
MIEHERAKMLQGFLDRVVIYHSAVFRDRFEEQARANLLQAAIALQRGYD